MTRTLSRLCCLMLMMASGACAQEVFRSRTELAEFTATAPGDTAFTLPVTWVEIDSIRVFRNGTEIGEFSHWRVLDPGNRIWLYVPLGRSDTLRVSYTYRPIPLFRSYARRSLRELGSASALPDTTRMAAAPPRQSETVEGWSRLRKSGSLIRSVQIGTDQDLELESALNLQIEGRVGKDIDVVAALTDQSTPIQPEGTTESISELEKVFVSIRSPRLAATLGDYTLDLPGGRYDSYNRKLTGVLGEATYPALALVASGAVSDGEFFTNSFPGQEAVQGPYPLSGRNGEIGIVVLAGTETVWVNGIRMRRGEGNDYVIDYASGEITFTAQRIITADSRIVVDFQYAVEDFERVYGALQSAVRSTDERHSLTTSWISETDDRSRPLSIGLNERDRDVLRASGDNFSLAVSPSADSLGAGFGDYLRVDTLVNGESISIFVFSPRDSADLPTGVWRVTFDDFGLGNGDYAADADERGRTFFRWVGSGLGRYLPLSRLPVPEQRSLVDVRSSSSFAAGLTVNTEVALSEFDRNTFSSLDDADDNGIAGAAEIHFSRQKPRILGWRPHRLALSSSLRARDRDFSEIARSTEIEFDREWDAVANRGTEETIVESSAELAPLAAVSLSGGYGFLERRHAQLSRRFTGAARFTPGSATRLSLSHLQILSDDSTADRASNWIRQRADAQTSLGRLTPRASVNRERKRNESRFGLTGFRYLDYRLGSGIALPLNLSADGEYNRRLDDKLESDDAFADSARAYTATGELAWRPTIGWTRLRYSHREKKHGNSDSADVITDVGRLESLVAPRNRVIEANTTYEVAKTRTQSQLLVAIEVEPGTGDYRRGEPGEPPYVPDDQGDIILVSRNTGAFEPATELRFSSLVWLRLDELQNREIAAWIRALSTETEITIEERTRRPLNARLLLLDPALLRGDSTISGRVNYRQDLHINRLNRALAVRIRYRQVSSLENQFLNGGQRKVRREGSARVRAQYLVSLRGESEAGLSRETTDFAAGTVPRRDIDRWNLRQDATLTLSQKWEMGLELQAEDVNDERSRVQASLRQVRPRVGYSLHSRGRFDADLTWIHAGSNRALIPFELGHGSNRGENYRWSARGTYQFGGNLSGSLNYTGRRDAGEKTFHTGRVEVRAMF